MLVSSLLVTAIKISQSLAPAFINTEGRLGIPLTTLTSRLSDILLSLSEGSSTTVTSNFSLDKMTSKFGEILDKYVKVQQHIELKLPTIKKL